MKIVYVIEQRFESHVPFLQVKQHAKPYVPEKKEMRKGKMHSCTDMKNLTYTFYRYIGAS